MNKSWESTFIKINLLIMKLRESVLVPCNLAKHNLAYSEHTFPKPTFSLCFRLHIVDENVAKSMAMETREVLILVQRADISPGHETQNGRLLQPTHLGNSRQSLKRQSPAGPIFEAWAKSSQANLWSTGEWIYMKSVCFCNFSATFSPGVGGRGR